MPNPFPHARFPLGRLVMTAGIAEHVAQGLDILPYLGRHARGDWGELDAHDVQANNAALRDGYRLLSAYDTPQAGRIWIITESNRSVTTCLLPEEY